MEMKSIEEGDSVLCRLHDKPLDDPQVQETKREILAAMESELEANKSLRWTQFLTMGIVDRSPLRIARRLSMCFWITFIREWMGFVVVFSVPCFFELDYPEKDSTANSILQSQCCRLLFHHHPWEHRN
jgi:hypothetical protein